MSDKLDLTAEELELLIYALGRGLESYDAPATRTIVRTAAREDYRLDTIILAIVNSVPFRMRQMEAKPTTLALEAR